MNKTLKRVICICLCAVLMFGVFTAPIVQPKADAFAITATAGMIAIGVTLLTMLGITFASVGAAEQASKSLLEGSQDIFDWVNDLSLQGGSGGEPGDGKWFKLGATTMAGLATFVNKARELFGNSGNSGSVEVPDSNLGVFGNIICTRLSSFSSAEEAFANAPYSAVEYNSVDNAIDLTINGVAYHFFANYSTSAKGYYLEYNSSGGNVSRGINNVGTGCENNANYMYIGQNSIYWSYTSEVTKLGFQTVLYNGVVYLCPFLAMQYVNSNNTLGYTYSYITTPITGCPVISTDLITPVYTDVPYQNISPYELNILYNALAEKLRTQEITFDYTDTLDQIENHSEEQLQVSQDQLLERAQIKDLLEQIKAGQGGTTKTELQESDLNVPEVPHDLTWKFPFCVPFDLIALVGALNATPQDPKWQIPFHIESLSIDESIELDLTKFEPVTNVLRVVTTIAFLLGLIMVTRKMIKG